MIEYEAVCPVGACAAGSEMKRMGWLGKFATVEEALAAVREHLPVHAERGVWVRESVDGRWVAPMT